MTYPMEVQPIPVHLTGADPGALPGVPPRRRRRYHVIPRTVTLTADTPTDQLLRPDPNREWAILIARGNDVVLTENRGDGQAAGNQADLSYPSVTSGGGQVVPAGPGTVIASWTVQQAGTYSITVAMSTAASVAADKDNMGLFVGSTLVAVLPASTNTSPQLSAPTVLALAAGQVVTVQQLAATTSTGYFAIITATPVPGPALVQPNGGAIPRDFPVRLPSITSELWATAYAFPTPVTVIACYCED